MAELSNMKNIGKEIEKKLKAIDIHTAEELIELGSKETYLRMKSIYPNVCLVHLYTLQGAIEGIDFNELSKEIKLNLKEFSDGLK